MIRRPRPKSERWVQLAIGAAILRSSGASEAQIVAELKTVEEVSQSTVSRMLHYAREELNVLSAAREVFHPEIRGAEYLQRVVDLIGSDRLRAAARDYLGNPLQERLRAASEGRRFRSLIIVPPSDQGALFRKVLVPILSEANVLGVTWGRSVSALVSAVKDGERWLPPGRNKVRFFPVCGEPFGSRTSQAFSSSALAEELHKVWNPGGEPNDDFTPPSIAGVPAFIPQKFKRSETRTVMKIIEMGAGYRQVFLGGDALINRADTLLTSTGAAAPEEARGIFLRERIQQGDLSMGDLKWILGDLGGVLIKREGASTGVRAKIDRLNRSWTGVRLDHFRACASRGSPAAGVVVLALHANRVPLVYRCIRDGLINTLLASGEVAEGLETLVAEDRPPK